MKKGGKRFEVCLSKFALFAWLMLSQIACYQNKVSEFRSGV